MDHQSVEDPISSFVNPSPPPSQMGRPPLIVALESEISGEIIAKRINEMIQFKQQSGDDFATAWPTVEAGLKLYLEFSRLASSSPTAASPKSITTPSADVIPSAICDSLSAELPHFTAPSSEKRPRARMEPKGRLGNFKSGLGQLTSTSEKVVLRDWRTASPTNPAKGDIKGCVIHQINPPLQGAPPDQSETVGTSPPKRRTVLALVSVLAVLSLQAGLWAVSRGPWRTNQPPPKVASVAPQKKPVQPLVAVNQPLKKDFSREKFQASLLDNTSMTEDSQEAHRRFLEAYTLKTAKP